jgi:hypothetical protein
MTRRTDLVMPRGAMKLPRGGGTITRFRCARTHRTNRHNFRSPAVCERLEASSKVKPIERRSRSAYCFAIERRSRLQGPVLRYGGCERSNGGVGRHRLDGGASRQPSQDDRTDEPVGNQGKRTGRFARVFCYRSNGRVGRFSATTRSNGRSSAVARLTATDRGGSTAVDRF